MVGAIEVAAATVSLLSPFLPHLKNLAAAAGETLVQTIASNGGEAAWERAKSLWGKLSARWADDPEVGSYATLVATQPANTTLREGLTEALAKKLEAEPDFLTELTTLIGGQQRVQEIVVGNRALLENVTQRMRGPGTQRTAAGDDAVVKGLTQDMD